ncbi:MAG: hypothetical protein GX821_12280 [Clostridiaceae bacterium]|nr:hypothetical protein [Eubacteriales bacterium]MDD4138749.1 hypothetical protein [Eubacteriales bacterium]MDD4744727.1 hypothetical protein [Eubacteriales bacterium]NLB45922.1 hypothetical protein [Clostridiaceae bacterium]
MKSQNRAWIMFVLVFLLWQTLPGSPFAYFADMIRQWLGLLLEKSALPGPWQPVLVYVFFSLLLSALLLLGRSRSRVYLAGICSLATLIHHLIDCIRTGRVYPVSLSIAIGLALALLFLLIKAKSPALWLSDAYTLALSVWMIRDGVLPPVIERLDIGGSKLDLFLDLPKKPLIDLLDKTWHLPAVVWALLPLVLALLPVVFFGRGRQKG